MVISPNDTLLYSVPLVRFQLHFGTVVLLWFFQAGPLRQYENSPYAESNDAVHAGSAQTLAYIYQPSYRKSGGPSLQEKFLSL